MVSLRNMRKKEGLRGVSYRIGKNSNGRKNLVYQFCTKCQQEVVPRKNFETCIFIFMLIVGF